jgi:hypothetical protein
VHVIVGAGGAEALELDVVLIAPPVRELGRRRLLPENGRGHPIRLPAGVRPVLAAPPVPARHVADRVHVLRRAALGVADHAVVQAELTARQPAGLRHRPDRLEHDVGRQHRAIGQRQLAGAAVRGRGPDPGGRGAHVQPHAVRAVQVGDEVADVRADDPDERAGEHVDEVHLDAHRAGAGGGLAADEPGADDGQARAWAEQAAQVGGVVEGPQHQAAQAGDPAGARAGGDHEHVVGQPRVAGAERALLSVQLEDLLPQPDLDVQAGVVVGRP